MCSRGALIVVEGLDRSGKSTQCRKLVENLTMKNIKVKGIRFPDRTSKSGQMINEYLTGKAELGDNVVHILFSQNRWEKNEEMRRDLHNGITLIVDRYAYSGTAFTAAKEGFDLEECKRVDSGLPRPDAVFFLNIDEEVAKLRGGYGEERYETEWFQKRVRHNFQCLRSEEWKVVDGGQPCDVVERQLEELALSSIEQAKTSPLHDLWPELKLKPEQYNNIDL